MFRRQWSRKPCGTLLWIFLFFPCRFLVTTLVVLFQYPTGVDQQKLHPIRFLEMGNLMSAPCIHASDALYAHTHTHTHTKWRGICFETALVIGKVSHVVWIGGMLPISCRVNGKPHLSRSDVRICKVRVFVSPWDCSHSTSSRSTPVIWDLVWEDLLRSQELTS